MIMIFGGALDIIQSKHGAFCVAVIRDVPKHLRLAVWTLIMFLRKNSQNNARNMPTNSRLAKIVECR